MKFLSQLLGVISGSSGQRLSEQLLFDKVIGFRGVVAGVGASTVLQNTAIALAESTNYSVCVLDVNYLYPTQYPMLVSHTSNQVKDFLDFDGDLSTITLATDYQNITLVSLNNRTIIDMLSNQDNQLTMEKVIAILKSYFDVVLVDLSHELSHINTLAAIKCNRIIHVADQSLKSVFHLQKSFNTIATLGVPLAKADRVILNKTIPDVLSNTEKVIEESGLTIIGRIPLSKAIATAGVAGKRLWEKKTANKEIYQFNQVISTIVGQIVHTTPLNVKYITDQPTVEPFVQDTPPVANTPINTKAKPVKKETTDEWTEATDWDDDINEE